MGVSSVEEQVRPVQGQVAVHLVGGNLMEAAHAVLAAGVHEGLGAQDIGAQEQPGVVHGAVHMGLRGEVHHDVRLFLRKEGFHRLTVGDVPLDEAEVGVLHGLLQGGQVARVGQAVQADHSVLRVLFQFIVYKIAADETGAAGDDDGHGHGPHFP